MGISPAQETRRNYHPLSEQEHLHTPLLMSRMQSYCGPCSVSLLQLCPLHRESLIFSGWTPVCNFREQTFWKDSGGHSRWAEMDVLLLGSLWGVSRTLNPCHFIIYRHVCIVSGAQLLSGIQLFAILWTIACQAPLIVEFSRQEYWRGLLFSPPGESSCHELSSPQLAGRSFTAELLGKPNL